MKTLITVGCGILTLLALLSLGFVSLLMLAPVNPEWQQKPLGWVLLLAMVVTLLFGWLTLQRVRSLKQPT